MTPHQPPEWAVNAARELYECYEPGTRLEMISRYADIIEAAYLEGIAKGLEKAAALCERVRVRQWTPRECAQQIRSLSETLPAKKEEK